MNGNFLHLRGRQKRLNMKYRLLLRGSTYGILSVMSGIVVVHFHLLQSTDNSSSLQTSVVAAQTSAVQRTVVYPSQNNPLFGTKPSWSQDFEHSKATTLDSRYWNTLVGPAENSNNEQQYYTGNPSNIRIANGVLQLIANRQSEPEGYKYGSARIETQGKQTFQYGRIDINAKLPKGVGTWPAVWLLPANDIYAQKSPNDNALRYRNGGEIDILESVGFQPDSVYGVAHTLSDLSLRADGTGSNGVVHVTDSSDNFNKYSLLWTPTSLTFEVNDQQYYTYTRKSGADYTTWPFDQPFYLIANLAIGGSWGGLDTAHFPGNGVNDAALPSSLGIRSIRYYPYIGTLKIK